MHKEILEVQGELKQAVLSIELNQGVPNRPFYVSNLKWAVKFNDINNYEMTEDKRKELSKIQSPSVRLYRFKKQFWPS